MAKAKTAKKTAKGNNATKVEKSQQINFREGDRVSYGGVKAHIMSLNESTGKATIRMPNHNDLDVKISNLHLTT